MKRLQLTDDEAQELIGMLKEILDKKRIDILNLPCRGSLTINSSINNKEFKLFYFININKINLQFMECEHNYTLIRVNLDDSFHRNANGEKIEGNRVNIFSEQEFIDKGDGQTHYKCYPLPFDKIQNNRDFITAFKDLMLYTNTNDNNIIINQHMSLF